MVTRQVLELVLQWLEGEGQFRAGVATAAIEVATAPAAAASEPNDSGTESEERHWTADEVRPWTVAEAEEAAALIPDFDPTDGGHDEDARNHRGALLLRIPPQPRLRPHYAVYNDDDDDQYVWD